MSCAAGDADTAADSGSADISRLSGVKADESHLAQSVAKRRNCIPAHRASVWTTSPSRSDGRSSHGLFTRRGEQQGEMENQLLSGSFFFLFPPISRCALPCATNKREKAAKKKLRCTVRQRSRQLGSLRDLCSHARCQRHSNHLSILDLSRGLYWSYIESRHLPSRSV